VRRIGRVGGQTNAVDDDVPLNRPGQIEPAPYRLGRGEKAVHVIEVERLHHGPLVADGCAAHPCCRRPAPDASFTRSAAGGARRHPTRDEPVDAMILPPQVAATIGSADVVVLAAPATPETHHVMDGRTLAAMKVGSVLVNVARGSLVDETALL